MVQWHPDSSFKPFNLKNAQLHHNVDCKTTTNKMHVDRRRTDRTLDTPYEGTEFTNWPRYTILRGSIVWANGKIEGKCGGGKYLKRGLSRLNRTYPLSGVDPRNVAAWLDGE